MAQGIKWPRLAAAAFRHLLRTTMAAAIGAGVALGAASSPAQAVTIFDPGGSFAGKTIANWTAAWWTWALQLPGATNSLSDTTGAYANLNNNGPVFFIAGNDVNSGPSTTRTFSVPDGRPVLLPMINLFDIEPSPPDPPDLTDRITSANLVVQAFLYPDSAEIRKTACQPSVKRFCLMDDPPRLPGQRIAPRPD